MTSPISPGTPAPAGKPSKNEALKAASAGLAGTLFEEIADPHTEKLSEDAAQLIKFHGSYQQDDRDQRAARRADKRDRAWMFMVRTKVPGGRLTAEQYLLADELAGRYGNGTLRITTRQTLQFHGIGKSHLKPLIRALNEGWISTYGACGDIARNVMACPVADLVPGPAFDFQALAGRVSDRYLGESTAYYELWLDGEQVLADGRRVKVQPRREETFYGPTYMPRKHKIGIGLPSDNCIDLFTHDLGLEAVLDEQGEVEGFNVVAGGGLGHTHGITATFPRLADRICFVTPEQVMAAVDAATAIYRDVGDRSNRRHARLKYVLEDRGAAWFSAEMARRLGVEPAPARDTSDYAVHDHLGWARQRDGRLLCGLFIENGRISGRQRDGLRAIVARTGAQVRLTPHQNLVLAGIPEGEQTALAALFEEYGLSTENDVSVLRRYTMACPALPTCGLAVAEAERYLPNLLGQLEQRGFGSEQVSLRMSGCPNSCSRPSTAEIGLIGRSIGLYNIYTGGDFAGRRLNRLYREDVREADLVETLADLLTSWQNGRQEGEAFGAWSERALAN